MPRRATTIADLARVRADQRDYLNHLVGTQGTALGRKNYDGQGQPIGDPCIIIYVPHKIYTELLNADQRIPETLLSNDGQIEALTDVVVTTTPDDPKDAPVLSEENTELVKTLQWRDGQQRFIGPGVQIGGGDFTTNGFSGYYGTLGYIVESLNNNARGFLTNQHVGFNPGHSIFIPSYDYRSMRIGVTRVVTEYTPDDVWVPGIDEMFAYMRTDAAFVMAEEKAWPHMRNEIEGIGDLSTDTYEINVQSMDIIGKPVKKIGRTTGWQKGTVVAVGYGIAGDDEWIDRSVGVEPANYYTDFLIGPRGESEAFSAPGDSGSCILMDTEDADHNRPVGLLWGGWPGDIGRNRGLEDLTYGIALKPLLKKMGLRLV